MPSLYSPLLCNHHSLEFICNGVHVLVVERSASWQFKSLYETALANLLAHFTGVVDIKVSSDILNFVDLPATTETTHNNQSKSDSQCRDVVFPAQHFAVSVYHRYCRALLVMLGLVLI